MSPKYVIMSLLIYYTESNGASQVSEKHKNSNKLEKIYDVYVEKKEGSYNYDANLEKYRATSNKYKEIPNFSSTFIESDEDFQMINEANLSDIKESELTTLKTFRFFKKGESKDVVNFELESQAYTCS